MCLFNFQAEGTLCSVLRLMLISAVCCMLAPEGAKHVLSAVLQPCSSTSFCPAPIKKHSVTFQFNGLRFIASHLKMILDSY